VPVDAKTANAAARRSLPFISPHRGSRLPLSDQPAGNHYRLGAGASAR
jgi:hypothetical protein